MKHFTLYAPDGVIYCSGECQDDMVMAQAHVEYLVLEGYCDPTVQYIANGAPVDKLPIQAVLASATITRPATAEVSNLPIPCTVNVRGTDYTSDTGTASISFNLPGAYPIKLSALHMLDQTLAVEVV